MKVEQVSIGSERPALFGSGRMPRWTRHEIMILIEGKRAAENRVGSGHGSESKWAAVSGHCRGKGVERGPVQCRKRWCNLATDFKKIKDWQTQLGSESDSFWVMRSDLRRERKLPGFFDKEVYDILEAHNATDTTTTVSSEPEPAALVLALRRCSTEADDVAGSDNEDEEAVFFDSGRSAAAEEGIFSDSETPEEMAPNGNDHPNIPAPVPISEQKYQPFTNGLASEGTPLEKQDNSNPEKEDKAHEGRKRKRSSSHDDDEDTNTLQSQLIGILEKNGQMLTSHLESQNTNSQLDREQRKHHVDSLVSVIGKLADALGRIADKL